MGQAAYPTHTSLTLLRRLGACDPGALGEVARLYRDPLCRSVERALHLPAADAEEAVQEMLRLFVEEPSRLARYDPAAGGGRFRTYLFAFAKNVSRNLRRKRRPAALPEDFDLPAGAGELDDELRRQEARRTLAWLSDLSSQSHPRRRSQRDAAFALLLLVEGRSHAEIGASLGVAADRVRYLIEAGRKLARERARTHALDDALSQEDFETLYARLTERLEDALAEAARERGAVP